MSEELQSFISRLNTNKINIENHGVPGILERLISKPDLLIIYEMVIQITLTCPNIESEIKTRKVRLQSQSRMPNSDVILPRSLSLYYNDQHEFVLILETKSKLADRTKNLNTPIFKGASKRGKPCFRIDTPYPENYVSMVTDISERENKIQHLREQKMIDNHLKNFVRHNRSYALRYKTEYFKDFKLYSTFKAVQYSPLAKTNLTDFIEVINKKSIGKELKLRFIEELLLMVKELHDNNIVHQDIKGQNILVFIDKFEQPHLKMTDYGDSCNLNLPITPAATSGFESPEILHLYSDNSKRFYQENDVNNFYQYYQDNRLSLAIKRYTESCLNREIKELLFTNETRVVYSNPHKANDMWAVGVMVFKIIGGFTKTLTELPQKYYNKLLAGLLEINRNKRITIDEAITLFNKDREACISLNFEADDAEVLENIRQNLTQPPNPDEYLTIESIEEIQPSPTFAMLLASLIHALIHIRNEMKNNHLSSDDQFITQNHLNVIYCWFTFNLDNPVISEKTMETLCDFESNMIFLKQHYHIKIRNNTTIINTDRVQSIIDELISLTQNKKTETQDLVERPSKKLKLS